MSGRKNYVGTQSNFFKVSEPMLNNISEKNFDQQNIYFKPQDVKSNDQLDLFWSEIRLIKNIINTSDYTMHNSGQKKKKKNITKRSTNI